MAGGVGGGAAVVAGVVMDGKIKSTWETLNALMLNRPSLRISCLDGVAEEDVAVPLEHVARALRRADVGDHPGRLDVRHDDLARVDRGGGASR